MSKKIITALSIIVIFLVIALGVTFSYFTAKIQEINKTKTIVKAGNLELVFTGEAEIDVEGILPGQSFIKTFSVENTNNIDMKFNIYIDGIINTFNDDLVYTIKMVKI